jgi:hypothetical protein
MIHQDRVTSLICNLTLASYNLQEEKIRVEIFLVSHIEPNENKYGKGATVIAHQAAF